MDDEQPIDLGVALFIPYRYTEDRIFRAIQDAGFDDWTLAQVRVFQRIAPDGSRLTDLAEQAQMSNRARACWSINSNVWAMSAGSPTRRMAAPG